MVDTSPASSPIESAAGVAGVHVTEVFELLTDETRLAILLALWEAYDPLAADSCLRFATLFDRVGADNSGNFSYHLEKLEGRFVRKDERGYRLRNAGRKIVQAIIAGAGLEERTLPPTEIDMDCYRCGADVEISYRDEHLVHTCTECEGTTGPDFPVERPAGTLLMFDFDPAGLTGRDPGEVFVAGTIRSLGEFALLVRDICPACSGPIERSLHVCEAHDPPPGDVCGHCGSSDEVRASYVCSVCKYGDSYPVHAAIYSHPAVVAFQHRHGLGTTYGLEEPDDCSALWAHLLDRTYEVVSDDPRRIRIDVPADEETLRVTIDADLEVVDITLDAPESGSGTVPSGTGALPDTEACLRHLRTQRWPEGIRCPRCGGSDTVKKGRTGKGAQRYRCRDCERIFNDLTGTVFAGHRLSLPEMFAILRAPEATETTALAGRLERSYGSVLAFVHQARDAGDWNVEAAFANE